MPFKAGVEGILLSCVGSSGHEPEMVPVVTSTPMKRLPKGLWYTKYFNFNFTIGVRCAIRVQLQVKLKALKKAVVLHLYQLPFNAF